LSIEGRRLSSEGEKTEILLNAANCEASSGVHGRQVGSSVDHLFLRQRENQGTQRGQEKTIRDYSNPLCQGQGVQKQEWCPRKVHWVPKKREREIREKDEVVYRE